MAQELFASSLASLGLPKFELPEMIQYPEGGNMSYVDVSTAEGVMRLHDAYPSMALATQLYVVLASFLTCLLISLAADSVSSFFLGEKYRRMSTMDKQNWCIGINRGLAGFYFCALAFPVFWDQTFATSGAEFVYSRSAHTVALMPSVCGFFLFENVSLLFVSVFNNYVHKVLWIHHILGGLFYWSVMLSGKMHYIAATVIAQEISAPFTSIGWMLVKMDLKDSNIYMFNQYVLLIVWFCLRMGNDVHGAYYTLTNLPAIFTHADILTATLTFLGCVTLAFFMNPHWFLMKVKQLLKAKVRSEYKVVKQD
eukprot:TRINITY_DN1303_c0_g1_i2.p1 TRINITY_DN1303_c0_g1~~TRINITY_DN1303_c0_g1_i2.p1  ORF type:complete len:310 (-),score=86.94 TRINITY_DN1303_c0_g1_i2:406-1335(-)